LNHSEQNDVGIHIQNVSLGGFVRIVNVVSQDNYVAELES